MPSEKQPNNPLTKLFADLDGHLMNSVKREDFERFGKILLDTVKSLDKRVVENMAQNRDVSASSVKEMKADVEKLKTATRQLIDTFNDANSKNIQQAVQQLREEVNRVREAIPTLPDYTDIFNEIQAKIPVLPPEKLGEDYRNALEALPDGDKLAIEAIENLRKELDELKKMKTGGGGSGIMNPIHWARHEKFTMDGVATTVTLTQVIGAEGNACIVRYQGQTLDMETHYTTNGNKITLVGITPDSGDIISVTYWP